MTQGGGFRPRLLTCVNLGSVGAFAVEGAFTTIGLLTATLQLLQESHDAESVVVSLAVTASELTSREAVRVVVLHFVIREFRVLALRLLRHHDFRVLDFAEKIVETLNAFVQFLREPVEGELRRVLRVLRDCVRTTASVCEQFGDFVEFVFHVLFLGWICREASRTNATHRIDASENKKPP